MAGKSSVTASDEERAALKVMASGADRAEADRARAVLLTLDGWISARIAQAFGVREDTVRLWRSDFMRGGVEALKALRVANVLLCEPVANRQNFTLARLSGEIASREGVTISRSQLSKVLRKKGLFAGVDPVIL